MRQLWSDILIVLDKGGEGYQQNVVKALASDVDDGHGTEHIRNLTSARPNSETCDDFVELVRCFFMAITHPYVLRCLSINTEVGNIYNSIGTPFFQHVAETLSRQAGVPPMLGSKGTSFTQILVALVTAAREMLRRCPKTVLHEDIPALGKQLSGLAKFVTDRNPTHSHILVSAIPEIEGMIQRAQGILINEPEGTKGRTRQLVVSAYLRDIELPGDRHDNDKLDITQIAIIPTESEIRSQRAEYLPSPLPSKPHFLQSKERHLDTYFRLHRHDIFGELKYIINGLLNRPHDDEPWNKMVQLSQGNVNAFVYVRAGVTHIRSTKNQGIEAKIAFQTPPDLRGKSASQRQRWWNATKRLEEGSLLCLISFQNGEGRPLFFTVTQRNTDPKAEYSLASERKPVISGKLTSATMCQLRSLITNFRKTDGLLVEVPGIIPATFMPVLENLQRMQKDSRLPFANWILEQGRISSESGIPPPFYARIPGFSFNLSPILTDRTIPLTFKPGFGTKEVQRKLEQLTTLDKGQCEALIAALSREFALIQGPPGTGKSHVGIQLMRTLLANKAEASLGPIIVVCCTNHALDQFLEHLLVAGCEKIIRIGGNSSSKPLEGKNLSVVSKSERKTSTEKVKLGQAFDAKDFSEGVMRQQLEKLRGIQNPTWNSIRDHLCCNYSKIYQQFFCVDADGFKMFSKTAPFDLWTTGKGENIAKLNGPCAPPKLTIILAAATDNVYGLALEDREVLLNHWANEVQEDIIGTVFDSIQKFNTAKRQIDLVHGEVSRRLLETADIIGVTTTGLAKNTLVLRSINAKVAICEEAGEVLEAHMLSALIPSVQHLIQIGDHEQLRPQITNFSLFSLESDQGRQYQLDRSLFERLAIGEPRFPIAQLNVQRRMRPQISRLCRNILYPKLVDHPVTLTLPDVVGMRKNVFWYHHTNLEDQGERNDRSHSNTAEVDITSALVRHIVRQGVYSSNDIAVLTPYAGQLRKLQMKLSSFFEVVLGERDQEELARPGLNGFVVDELELRPMTDAKQTVQKKPMNEFLRVATVDNFQGEEAKIVIISLVRSNKLKRVGFLKTTNRINVLLSRAQHGMYLIGNADTYNNVPMWRKILGMLREADSVGEAFSLCCPRHPETDITVSKPEDFELLSPEGGCREPCDK
jgi:AAA domain